MTKAGFAAFAAIGLALALPAAAQQKAVVSFPKGASSATKSGSIRGDHDANYLIDARAGQTLTVTLKTTKGSPYMNITAPGADEALFIGSSAGEKFTGKLPADGRYTIQVYQMRATARRNETAGYALTIGITDGAPFHASEDALVAGTPYNATADIRCITEAGGKTGACHAGVTRKGGGDATVDLKTPDGGARKIYFTKGNATGSDAARPVNTTKSGDISTVRIGAVEIYYIPDAFVFGG